jgi:RimJ/RimL family protein N-acetyltransferase
MQITLDPVQFDNPVHLRWWYEVRNSEPVRNASRSRKKITVDEHYIWWQESKVSKTRKLFFIRKHDQEFQPQVVGIARVDHRRTWTEFSLAIEAEWRRHGFGCRAIDLLKNETATLKWPPPGAVIHGKNTASLLSFIKCGFVLKKSGFIQVTLPNPRRT